ncbi:MAG TPA: cation:proton antiporter [Aeromicrobium sp.]|nr:cation:proton antiporter [Aeromicrobium sp.]
MHDIDAFGLLIAGVSAALLAAILANHLTERFRVPAPAIFLAVAAASAHAFPDLGGVSFNAVQRIVTVALVIILFDGGMHIGARRFRESAAPIALIGVAGTAATAAALAVIAHAFFDFGWQAALLLGAALAATDPAVVFSVLGKREIAGRTGTILEGESGANDPVGIALALALLTTSGSGAGAWVNGLGQFGLQMAVGLAVGIVGGRGLLVFIRHVPLPGASLYSVRVLAGALGLYGVATVLHGSGFLAVFVAGILLGDEPAPHKKDIVRFHSALASLGEIVAFAVLGLTISVSILARQDVWLTGLMLGALLMLVVRPVLLGLVSWPIDLTRGERVFVLWAGLKGAVPILLGTFAVTAHAPDSERIYGVIFVVVALSVIVQGSSVPTVAQRLGIPMKKVET